MLVGYARVSKSDGNLDLQKDSLISEGIRWPNLLHPPF
jgi:DNA invertase Pin-like site-specific DNA recombinase